MCIGGINATLIQNPRRSKRVDDALARAATSACERAPLDDAFRRHALTTAIGVV